MKSAFWLLGATLIAGAGAAAAWVATSPTVGNVVVPQSAGLTVAPPGAASGTKVQSVVQSSAAADAESTTTTIDWARIVDGKLTYRSSANGDRIMDFSTAGYRGDGEALPTGLPVRITLQPSGGDDTAAIQAAIDQVSALSADANGVRGAIGFGSGTFRISKTITLAQGGIVLTGSGTGSNGTTIRMTGDTGFLAFQIGRARLRTISNTARLASRYIPSGSTRIAVESTAGFAVGQRVEVARNVTADWISHVGMDKLVRDGKSQTWLQPGTGIATARAITAIDAANNMLTLDAPLTDSFDATYLGSPVGTVSQASYPGQITEVGLRSLRIAAPAGTTVYSAIAFDNVMDGFVSDVVGEETQNAFAVAANARRITFDRVVSRISVVQTAGAPKALFSVTGSQVLLNRCASQADGTWAFVTGTAGTGPVVLLNFSTTRSVGIGPHQRWYTGILVDSATLPNATADRPGIAFSNRTTLGSGQGWTTGWSVAWNVTSPYFRVQAAPGSMNWCIGCHVERVAASPSGTYSASNATVVPNKLYLQQLLERKGRQSLANIGS